MTLLLTHSRKLRTFLAPINCFFSQPIIQIELSINYVHDSEKAMAPHSSTLAWKIPRAEEPGGLQSMGLLWVRHNWATSLSFFTFMHWRRKRQPAPVFLPGKSQGWGSLLGCHLWGCKGSDTTWLLNNNKNFLKWWSKEVVRYKGINLHKAFRGAQW